MILKKENWAAFLLAAVFALFTLLVFCNKAVAGTPNASLLMQTAHSGRLDLLDAEKQTYQLTLYNVEPYVSYFTDRPRRKTGLMPLQDFIQLWTSNQPDNFKAVPPNVAIETISKELFLFRKHENVIAEITDARFNTVDHTVTYTLHFLKKNTEIKPHATLAFTTLVFDGVNWDPGGY